MTLRCMRGEKKRMVLCNAEHRGSSFARHESVQTSHWCFVARKVVKLIKQRKANDGLTAGASLASLYWCKSLAGEYRKVCSGTVGRCGLILDAAQWLSRVINITIFTGFAGGSYLNRPLKGLSRMMGNYHVRFLWGDGP